MKRHNRTTIATAVAVMIALGLSACAFLGPQRDADGRVTEATEINSSALLDGDCFSFVENTNESRSIVTPCADEHTFIVIDQGELDAAAIESAGGLQNAVNAACDEPFSEFKAAAADGVKPQQQFIVSEVERDEKTFTKFSCVATDSVAVEAEG